jgi:membrane-associated protease RseP (regulator of RpoE activity)
MDDPSLFSVPPALDEVAPAAPSRRFPTVHVVLFVATGFTTVLLHGVAFAAALIAILAVHESGHYVMCRRHGVAASLPYFLPAPFALGTFGAFIRIRSRFPDRRALFDIGAAGPWAGFVVAVVVTAIGLHLSTVSGAAPQAPMVELGDSLLTTLLTWLVLGADPSHVVLHPVAFAGWVGLFVTSLNLLPAGQLDGGHVLYAISARRSRALPGALLAFLVWLGFRGQPVWFFWAVIIALMTFLGHPPTLNDLRPLDGPRRLATLGTLALFVLTFVPEPIRIVA